MLSAGGAVPGVNRAVNAGDILVLTAPLWIVVAGTDLSFAL